MKIVIRNKGKKQVKTPWPIKGKVNAGKKGEFEVPDNGAAALMIMGYAIGMERHGIQVQVFKGDLEYKVVKTGAMPTLMEV